MKSYVANFCCGAALAGSAVASLFVAESVAISIKGLSRTATIADILAGISIAAFLLGLVALVAAIGVGLIAAYVGGTESTLGLIGAKRQRMIAALLTPEPEFRLGFFVRVVGLGLLACCWFGLALKPVYEIVIVVQTPWYAALLSIGVVLLSGLVALIAWPVWRRTAILLAGLFRRVPAPWMIVAAIGFLIVFGASATVIFTWKWLASYVAWRTPLVIFSGAALFLASLEYSFRYSLTPNAIRRILAGGTFVFFVGFIVAVALPSSMGRMLRSSFSKTPVTPVYLAVVKLLDTDEDGHISWFGGNDCAAFDPEINPSSLDIPDDGIDQDCDGADNILTETVGPGRHDYPLGEIKRPTALFLITLDAVSARNLDLYGYKRKTMPRLSHHARDATVFKWAFSHGPSTRTSFPSMMTSRYDTQIIHKKSRRMASSWDSRNVTFAEIMSKAGYDTVGVAPDSYFSKKMHWIYEGFKTTDTSAVEGRKQHKSGRRVTASALAQIKKRSPAQKIFAWIHYTDAHGPHSVPSGRRPFPGGRQVDIYDRELSVLDSHVSQLVAGIKQRYKNRPYVILLTADHGEAFDRPHRKHHHGFDLSTAVTQVPFIVWSGFSKGKTIDTPVNTIDAIPTLANMVGIKHANLVGESVIPALQGKQQRQRPILQQMYLTEKLAVDKPPLQRLSVRLNRFVLHKNMTTGDETMFDYRIDPLETKDLLAKHSDQAKVLRSYRDGMMLWAGKNGND
jgi:arylsulfatase A-like enzyme